MSGHGFWCHCRWCALGDALLTLWESVRVGVVILALVGLLVAAVSR